MSQERFCLFETTIGTCAAAWNERGLTAVFLPESGPDRLRARIGRRHPQALEAEPPPAVAEAMAAMRALLAGEPRDLSFVALDLSRVGEFERRVYEIIRGIPPGQTLTYGEIARRLDDPGAAQAVGRALGRNPWPIVAPCHRVLGAGGKVGGFSAPGGAGTKLRMLEIEGALRPEALPLFGG
jgi:methylated-DNA-[protein]-cysteine S-methyltransferase